jgi:putative hydrolase of the HAD superfamily
MNKIIIFDFNRTLFDPEKQALVSGCVEMLKALGAQNFNLHLISMAAESRADLIKNLGLDAFFQTITICEKKTVGLFRKIIETAPTSVSQSFVVGDRVTKEISFGNALGLNTIWYRNGKFAQENPQAPTEYPTYTVTSLDQIPLIIQNHPNNMP